MRKLLAGRRGRYVAVGALLALTTAGVVAVNTGTATGQDGGGSGPDTIRVTDTSAVKFDGRVHEAGAVGPASVPECAAANCDHYRLKVDLSPRVWSGKVGGVQVTIAWEQLFNDIALLLVYKDGVRVAASDAFVTTFQSVRLNTDEYQFATPNGTYDVYVAYAGYPTDAGVPPSPKIKYKGWAQVQYEVPVNPVRDLLPDLLPIAPRIATFEHPPAIFGDEPALDTVGCFTSERDEQGAAKCLRIEQRMWNQNGRNRGPLEIRFNKPIGETPPSLAVSQRIYRSDGSWWDRSAGFVDLHPFHGHYHYVNYTISTLHVINPDGTAGAVVGTGHKNGFCLADTDVVARANERYVAPMVYTAPNCLEPRPDENPGPGLETLVEGQGTGNGDTYGWDLPDQYIEVSGVADGTYIVQTEIDPDRVLEESSATNNCIAMFIRLTNMATATPTAELLGRAPRCVS